jgi:hypothetical protein
VPVKAADIIRSFPNAEHPVDLLAGPLHLKALLAHRDEPVAEVERLPRLPEAAIRQPRPGLHAMVKPRLRVAEHLEEEVRELGPVPRFLHDDRGQALRAPAGVAGLALDPRRPEVPYGHPVLTIKAPAIGRSFPFGTVAGAAIGALTGS